MHFFNVIKKELKNHFLFWSAIVYALGFIAWNRILKQYGIFEFNIIETRYLATGVLSILLMIICLKFFERYYKNFKKLENRFYLLVFLIWFFILTPFFLPFFPEYLGGTRSSRLVSLILPAEQLKELNDNFNIPLTPNANKKSSVQTSALCNLYSNNSMIVVGVIDDGGKT